MVVHDTHNIKSVSSTLTWLKIIDGGHNSVGRVALCG